jgi:hypothetical protein
VEVCDLSSFHEPSLFPSTRFPRSLSNSQRLADLLRDPECFFFEVHVVLDFSFAPFGQVDTLLIDPEILEDMLHQARPEIATRVVRSIELDLDDALVKAEILLELLRAARFTGDPIDSLAQFLHKEGLTRF